MKAAGFTLMEMLIALVLLTLLATLAFGGLDITTQAWQRQEQRIGQQGRVEAVSQLLRRQLEGMSIEPIADTDGHLVTPLQASSDRLLLLAPGLNWQQPQPTWLLLSSRRQDDGYHLELRTQPFVKGSPVDWQALDAALADSTPRWLLTSNTPASFSYLQQTEPERWQSSWPQGAQAPLLVKLTLANQLSLMVAPYGQAFTLHSR